MFKFLNGNFNGIKVDFSWRFHSVPVVINIKNNKDDQHNHNQSHETEEQENFNWTM
jgi:hypothetical protein